VDRVGGPSSATSEYGGMNQALRSTSVRECVGGLCWWAALVASVRPLRNPGERFKLLDSPLSGVCWWTVFVECVGEVC